MKRTKKAWDLNTLVKVPCPRLTNEMHLGFHLENGVMIGEFGATELGIAEYATQYADAIHDEDVAIEQVRRSADTSRIAEADVVFDNSYTGMHTYIQACLHHVSPEVRYSAQNLAVIFDQYGNIGRHSYRSELMMSRNILTDLRERPADIQATGLTVWMNAHESAATKLRELMDARSAEIASRSKLQVKETRKNTDGVYHLIISRVESMININGVNYVPGFVDAYNTHATEYKNTLAQHLGRVHAGKDGGEEASDI